MTLIKFLDMFYQLGSDIDKIVLWQNGKCLGTKTVGDTKYIRQEYMKAKVKKFTFPKKSNALYVILEEVSAPGNSVTFLQGGRAGNECKKV